jgi:hypothetical protein
MAQFVEHELGCHLNLRHDSYIQDSGLGYGALVENLKSPIEYWHASAWNPLRPTPPENKGFLQGTAAHTKFLDGVKVYDKVYGVRPSRATHPRALVTTTEISAELRKRKLSTSGLKPELVRRLADADPTLPILDNLQAQFERSGKIGLPLEIDFAITQLHAMAMKTREEMRLPDGSQLTIREALAGGLAEVSVFWIDENGIRQRARFDKLKPNVTIDLKTITDWKKSDFRKSLLRETILRGYVVQAAHYDEARRQLRIAVAEGRVWGGNKTQRKMLERIARAETWGWMWIFAKMNGAPQVKGIVLPRVLPWEIDANNPQTSTQYNEAVQQRATALLQYQYYKDFFGLENAWFDTEIIWVPQHDDWPPFLSLENE